MRGVPIESLRRVPLFSDLNRREMQAVARLFKERRFPAGETVIKEGSGGAAFFVIESGEAKVSVGGNARSTLGPGDFFGEIALIDQIGGGLAGAEAAWQIARAGRALCCTRCGRCG
jgi:CRP/FNR family transcriptional regulator, cyclic AMP receptor protein